MEQPLQTEQKPASPDTNSTPSTSTNTDSVPNTNSASSTNTNSVPSSASNNNTNSAPTQSPNNNKSPNRNPQQKGKAKKPGRPNKPKKGGPNSPNRAKVNNNVKESGGNNNNAKNQRNAIDQPLQGVHTLQSPWTFWFCKKLNKPSGDFENALISIGTCRSVEEFWGLYSHLKRPSELQTYSTLHLFRGNTQPMWENFPNGGEWVLRIRKRCPFLSRLWEELLFACIGEIFEDLDVVGVVLSIRQKDDSLHLWNKDQNLRNKIGEKLRAVMNLPSNALMEYRTNKFNMERRQSGARRDSIPKPVAPASTSAPVTTAAPVSTAAVPASASVPVPAQAGEQSTAPLANATVPSAVDETAAKPPQIVVDQEKTEN